LGIPGAIRNRAAARRVGEQAAAMPRPRDGVAALVDERVACLEAARDAETIGPRGAQGTSRSSPAVAISDRLLAFAMLKLAGDGQSAIR